LIGESATNIIQVIPVEDLPLIKNGDNLGKMIVEAAKNQGTPIQPGDVVVVTHVAVSKSEGKIVNLDTVKPSEKALEIAKQTSKDPALVEVILQETKDIVRIGQNSIITETCSGTICANAGVDRSNVAGERNVVPLPKNPNASAEGIRTEIKRLCGADVAVIVSDTHGRPFRLGEINVAVGTAGFKPIRDRRGEKDLFGYVLKIKQTAIADELASAAELVMGQAGEGIPAAIVRGYSYQTVEDSSAVMLIRPKEKDLFRQPHQEGSKTRTPK
jgi:coenzyme F420-0:L-glutamate ligase/coenzyme F420-1:gamma-L-glutamate ligase